MILGKHFNLKPKAKTESVENSEFWLSIGAHHSSVSISLTFLAALEPLAREFCSNFRLETLHAEDYYSTTGVTSWLVEKVKTWRSNNWISLNKRIWKEFE